MTRKDYERIASIINETRDTVIPGGEHRMYSDSTLYNLADRMADELQRENPKFNRERFISACGFSS